MAGNTKFTIIGGLCAIAVVLVVAAAARPAAIPAAKAVAPGDAYFIQDNVIIRDKIVSAWRVPAGMQITFRDETGAVTNAAFASEAERDMAWEDLLLFLGP